MFGSYSEINSFLAEAKKKKVTTTADFEAEKVDDSCVKMSEGAKPPGMRNHDDPNPPGQYQIGDYVDNSAAVKKAQQRRMDTLNRIIKDDPKKWDFSQQNVNRRIVTGESVELDEGSAAWQRSEGKNKSGGLNEKGRKSYERENPGSDLKAPSKKKGNKRRASFCARMKGMKKKLTSAKTASDPDSRINKSLRAWNC
tara:strand:+ start:1064 stop:1654 length:591 start_codon:yes stop_codon:yes gene_type:complete